MLPNINTHPAPWLAFKQPQVRELAYCIASPPLLQHWPNPALCPVAIDLPSSGFWHAHFVRYLPRLMQLEQAPDELLYHLAGQQRIRLGHRFEHLLAFWLLDSQYHPYTLLGRNLQRHEGKRTLGEADFLIYNRHTRLTEHWEVTLKFYLGNQPFKPVQWAGLNQQDTLQRKLDHLCQHQFKVDRLKDRPVEQRRAIIKGRLFYPFSCHLAAVNQPLQDFPASHYLAPDHLTGLWGDHLPRLDSVGETRTDHACTDGHWHYIPRQQWLAPLDPLCGQPAHRLKMGFFKSGLYVWFNPHNEPLLHFMLRISDKRQYVLKTANILQSNCYVTDIFKANQVG